MLKTVIDKTLNNYLVTGTFHGSIVTANSEGEARRLFHTYYNGESILHVIKHSSITFFV
jgi:hypothetical protein